MKTAITISLIVWIVSLVTGAICYAVSETMAETLIEYRNSIDEDYKYKILLWIGGLKLVSGICALLMLLALIVSFILIILL